MSDHVISVNGLSKKYVLGNLQNSHDSFRGRLESLIRSPFNRTDSESGNPSQSAEFWALKNVSFSLKKGTVLGVIGRNGAGKSTLLKLLSRITYPTEGEITLRGRVASLLEVGTGFHQELTGRENIFLNGAILGMTRKEIKQRFDEIVAFSEIEKFLDTPVKRYSSGMYVRLAFAVAAHLEPEILIVDEVLAVGDVQFQRKCLQKMEGIHASGRTVIFVSHHIPSVMRLCTQALWLDRGTVSDLGETGAVCAKYLSYASTAGVLWENQGPQSKGATSWLKLHSARAVAPDERGGNIPISSEIRIELEYEVSEEGRVFIPNIHLSSDDGSLIFIAHDWFSGWKDRARPKGRYCTSFLIPANLLSEGRILVKIVFTSYKPFEIHIDITEALAFNIIESGRADAARGDYSGHYPGAVRPVLATETTFR